MSTTVHDARPAAAEAPLTSADPPPATPGMREPVGAGWAAWWGERRADLGISATSGLSASVVSLTVATVLTALVTVPAAARAPSRS